MRNRRKSEISEASLVVLDPKGAAVKAAKRRKFGRVVIINPFGVPTDRNEESSCFNPFARLGAAPRQRKRTPPGPIAQG